MEMRTSPEVYERRQFVHSKSWGDARIGDLDKIHVESVAFIVDIFQLF